MKAIICGLLGLAAGNALALEFKTELDESQWVNDSSPYSCRLEHYISGYGVGAFVHEAGNERRLVLDGQGINFESKPLQVSAEPPRWKPGHRILDLSALLPSHGQVETSQILATEVATELLRGMMVKFRGTLKGAESQPLNVSLSTVGFRSAFDEFTACEDQLLPASFSQLERVRIQYKAGAIEINDAGEQMLRKIVTFLETDDSVKQIFIDGHTDNVGLTRDNVATSKRRAELVRDYLLSEGVPEDMLVVRYHAEKYPVVQNSSAANRAMNRRTTLRLSREFRPQPNAVASADQS